MAKLRTMAPLLRAATPRLKPAQAAALASGFQRDDGLSSTARGYGADWRRVRAHHLAGEPLCRFCAEAGRVKEANEVDHIFPFKGLDDPLRLSRTNLRSLCTTCHRIRTARQAHGRG